MEYQLSPNQWLTLPLEVRHRIAETFKVPRSKGTTVVGNVVQSDGYTFEDLAKITVEGMQDFLKSDETDFMTLFNKVVEVLSVNETKPVNPKDALIDEWIYRLNQMKAQATEQDMLYDLTYIVDKIINDKIVEPEQIKNANVKKRTTKKTD